MLHRRILTILLVGLTGFIFTAPAGAAKAPHRYSPKHGGTKCRAGYKRVVKLKKHRQVKIFCVRRASKKKAFAPGGSQSAPSASSATAEKPKLHSHVDPTYTRNPLDPFEVTYQYSASASQEASPESRALGIFEEPAPLPSGVLSLFSDGKLECAINVGSGVEASECPVNYQALGQHSVTTIYTSGEQSATETEIENIEPLPASVSLAMDSEEIESGVDRFELDVTSDPVLQSPVALRLSVPGYWNAPEPVVSGTPVEVRLLCENGLAWFGKTVKSEAVSPKEPLSYFEGLNFVATFESPGYATSVAQIPVPAPSSCFENP